MEASILTSVVLPLALFIIMFGMGMSLAPKDFNEVFLHPKAAFIGIIAQMVMLPLLAFAILKLYGFTGPLAVGLMILALCPGGTTSNLYTYLAKGDVALSVTLTSVVSLIAPFTVPVLIVFFMNLLMGEASEFELPIVSTIIQLVAITILPISLGMLVNKFKPVFAQRAEKPMKIFSVVFLFIIVAGIIANNSEHMVSYFMQTGAAVLTLNIACLIMGYLIARGLKLNIAQGKAIAIEVGLQNGTLAIVIALTLIENTEMAIASTMYSLLMFVTGAAFVWVSNTFLETE
jgi:BASS family bile acid:Na+ symporter